MLPPPMVTEQPWPAVASGPLCSHLLQPKMTKGTSRLKDAAARLQGQSARVTWCEVTALQCPRVQVQGRPQPPNMARDPRLRCRELQAHQPSQGHRPLLGDTSCASPGAQLTPTLNADSSSAHCGSFSLLLSRNIESPVNATCRGSREDLGPGGHVGCTCSLPSWGRLRPETKKPRWPLLVTSFLHSGGRGVPAPEEPCWGQKGQTRAGPGCPAAKTPSESGPSGTQVAACCPRLRACLSVLLCRSP